MKAINNAEAAPRPVGAYSQAVVSGGCVYCAGQIGIDPSNGMLVSGGVAVEAERALSNLASVLQSAGASFDTVVMTTIFLVDISDAAKVNEIYARFVNSDSPPARQTVAVAALPLNARIEISIIAELV